MLTSEPYYRPRSWSHRVVFDAIRRLHAAELPVDMLTVGHDLHCRGVLTTAGRPDAVDRLVAEVPAVADNAALEVIRSDQRP